MEPTRQHESSPETQATQPQPAAKLAVTGLKDGPALAPESLHTVRTLRSDASYAGISAPEFVCSVPPV